MDQCIFCDRPLEPGSEEHVFLSAIGGRIATRRATCTGCNNSFAVGDKVDDVLATSFLVPRCGLQIWTGRQKPPPTIRSAGAFPNGTVYDLAPGFVPMVRPASIPAKGTIQGDVTISAKDENDAKRIVGILRARGEQVRISNAQRVQQNAPEATLGITFDGPPMYRSVAKTALAAACVLFGNKSVRESSDVALRASAKTGAPDIGSYAGWDYANEWPQNIRFLGHRIETPAAISGFEHSVFICDVGDSWVAYVQLFGHFRLSVWLGPKSGLSPKGLAVNPRAGADGRMVMQADPPSTYERRQESSFRSEHAAIMAGTRDGLNAVMRAATTEAEDSWHASLAADLMRRVREAANETEAKMALNEWSEKVASLHVTGRWEESLDTVVIDE